MKQKSLIRSLATLCAAFLAVAPSQAADKKPNVVILMTDDTGWGDFGCYSGGGADLGHPTPNIDKVASEGALFT
jgi:arylsulfatase